MLCASPWAELGQRDRKLRLLRLLAPPDHSSHVQLSSADTEWGWEPVPMAQHYPKLCSDPKPTNRQNTRAVGTNRSFPLQRGVSPLHVSGSSCSFCGFQRHPCTKMSHGRDVGRLGGLRLPSCKDLPCENPSVGKGSRSETPRCAELRGVCGWQSWERPLPACPGMCCCKIAGV